jgi:alpha-galactosidase
MAHLPVDRTEGLPAGGSSVHLRGPSASFVLDLAPDAGAQILHWGPALPAATDLIALREVSVPATSHSAMDVPFRRPALPMGSDGWRMRPVLSGSRPDGTAFAPRLTPVGMASATEAQAEAATLVCADPEAALTLTTTWRLHTTGVLTVEQSLRNDGASTYLVGALQAVLPVPDRAREVLDLTGRWCRERSPQRHLLPMGAWVREGRHGRTGHDSPLLLVAGTPGFDFASGEVWSLHVAWSGDSVYSAERSPSGYSQLSGGELLLPGEVRLEPGQTYDAPAVAAVYAATGLDGMSAQWHAFVRARPGHPATPRPVVLNTWEAVYFDHRLDKLTALADAAAELGVERFVLDDGWFGGRRCDDAGLGDWVVSEAAWPDGLAPLVDHVVGLGMDFGLWVEPEMVNLDSDLYRAHPEWVLATPGRMPPPWRRQQVLDLAHEGAFEHVLRQLDALLTTYRISYLKWDHNRDLIDPGHLGAPGVRAQTLAVYRLLDELRARHRGVEIESCASGGGRIDLGILQRTDRVWASDTIDALERENIQRWTGLLVPPELVGSHVGAGVSHTTGRRHTLALRSTAALFGHFGVEADLTALDPQARAGVADAVATYKELRSVLHTGRVVQIDHPDDSLLVHGVVGAQRAVFGCVRVATGSTEVPPAVRLRGLDEAADYRVCVRNVAGGPTMQQMAGPAWIRDGGMVLSGSVLQRVGLPLPVLHPESTLLLVLDRL